MWWIFLIVKTSCKLLCHGGWVLIGFKVCVNHISMWLLFWLGVMPCLLQLTFYTTCPRWLEEFIIAHGI
jgi:hypothetical protein